MAYPVNTGSFITATNFNELVTVIEDVAGTSPTGYGRRDLFSIPVTTGTRITRSQLVYFFNDLNRINQHQWGSNLINIAEFVALPNSATWVLSTSTSSVLANYISYLSMPGFLVQSDAMNFVNTITGYIVPTRYQVSATQLTPVITEYGTSVQTGTWTTYAGVPVDAIHHIVEAKWANTLTAAYFFNLGGEIRLNVTSTSNTSTMEDVVLQEILAAISTSTATVYNRNDYVSPNWSTATVFARNTPGGDYRHVNVKIEKLNSSTFTASIFMALSITSTSTPTYNLGTPLGAYWTTSTNV